MTIVNVRNLTRRTAPRFAYTAVTTAILPNWEISLVFTGPTQARKLNEQLRGRSYTPNVLSYIAGKQSGEIIICLQEAIAQAPKHHMDEREFVLYLFIHGLLHLKGMAHGSTMERCEHEFLTQFYGTTHSDWHRHRDVPSKNGRRGRAGR